jgi:type IV fimbrial biogenesis protein FimT
MPKKEMAGISTIEHLISVLIITMLGALSAPTFTAMNTQIRISETTQRLFSLVQTARHSALTKQTRVSLCPLLTSGRCSTNWSQTLSVFADHNGNRQLDGDDNLLHSIEIPEQIELTWQGMGGGNSLHFNRQGITFVSNGTFTLRSDDQTKSLVISRLGKPRVTEP